MVVEIVESVFDSCFHVKVLIVSETSYEVNILLLIGKLLVLLEKSFIAVIQDRVVRIALVRGSLLDNNSVWALLVQEVFVLYDAGEIYFRTGVVDNGVRLVESIVHLAFNVKADGTVFQFLESKAGEVVVYRSSIDDDFSLRNLVLKSEEVGVQVDINVVVLKQVDKERCVAFFWEALVCAVLVSGVVVITSRKAGKNFWSNVPWPFLPLLVSVVLKDLLVEHLTDTGFGHFFAVGNLVVLDAVFGKPLVHLLDSLNVLIAHHVDGCDIRRNAAELAVDHSDHLMFPAFPFGKLADVVINVLVVGKEEVGSILVHQDSSLFVDVVKAIASNVGSLFNDENLLALFFSESTADNGTRESSTNNDDIVVLNLAILRTLVNVRLFARSNARSILCVAVVPTGIDLLVALGGGGS
mmetsp:Transcript_10076/g.18337  ORF Transcript_10076/g.18337 Transcript_10076/m.18337 type:complete len:411 (-) Transcript_10076:92-1324(-)